MKKSRGIAVLLLTAIVTVFFCYVAAVGIGPTGTGSAKNINTGLDLAGGVSITYQAKDSNPSKEDMSDTVYKMQQRVSQYSTEAQAYQEGSNRITIEIPGVSDANAILEELGKPGSLYFIDQTDADGNQNFTTGNSESGYVLARSIEDIQKAGSVVLKVQTLQTLRRCLSGFIHKLPEICSQSDSYKEWKNQICGSYQGKC